MSLDIKESDWKIFRDLHDELVERCYERFAAEMQYAITDKSKPARERFHEVGDLYKSRRRDVADMFDGLRRSTAMLQLIRIRREMLITDKEMARFSPELREWVESVMK